MARMKRADLLQMARDNNVSHLVDVLAQVKDFGWHENSESTHKGSFRYSVRTEPNGGLRVLFGINASGKYRPLHGSLCVWVRTEVAAEYRGTPEGKVREELKKFTQLEQTKDGQFLAINNSLEAIDLRNLLEVWSADAKNKSTKVILR